MKELLDQAIIGYKLNHPNEQIEEYIAEIITDEIDSILNKKNKDDDIIFYITEDNNYFAPKLRKKINNETKDQNTSKEILKIIYQNFLNNLDNRDRFNYSKNYAVFINENQINIVGCITAEDIQYIDSSMLKSLKNKKDMKCSVFLATNPGDFKIDDTDIKIDSLGNIKVLKENVEYGKIDVKKYINSIYITRTFSYSLMPLLIELLAKEEDNIINVVQTIDRNKILSSIAYLLNDYIKNIDITKVLKESGFKIPNETYQFLTNAKGIKLQNTLNGKLLEGSIKLSTDKGYQNNPEKKQQDAILSVVKDETCFLNVIADGAGGSKNGEEASKYLTLELKEWFENMPQEILDDIDILIKLLEYKITQIDNYIFKTYKNSYTTLALTLTINDKTIIANIGDSTAYTYDEQTDNLVELTTLDSESKGMDYEEARYNPWNNALTAAIGAGYNDKLHINIIDNTGQKIILSSDGITDLVSEERFKSYFKENIEPEKMVEDALSKEYTEWLDKREDNISVISIKLPNSQKSKQYIKKTRIS